MTATMLLKNTINALLFQCCHLLVDREKAVVAGRLSYIVLKYGNSCGPATVPVGPPKLSSIIGIITLRTGRSKNYSTGKFLGFSVESKMTHKCARQP